MKTYKYNVLSELYKLKLIDKSLLFELTEAIEANFYSNHLKKIDKKLEIVKLLPPIFQMEAIDRFLHSKKISSNSFFRGLNDYIIKELLVDCKIVTVPAGEFIYQSQQPSDSSRPS